MTTSTMGPGAGRLVAGVVALAVVLAACGDDGGSGATSPATAGDPVIAPGDGGEYVADLDPGSVVDRIDNPYLPLLPGARWVYEGTSDGERERIEVTVIDERRRVMGIDAVVVRDTVTSGGELVEDTRDWFVQDADGAVWYLGEESVEYADGEPVSTEGSWEAGVDGAQPGIIMPAQPTPGDAYRQEYLPGEAEDMAEVLAGGRSLTVGGRAYGDVVVIREWTPLEPEAVEEKSYAPGVGQLLERQTAGGGGRAELVEYEPGTTG
jgi:hypothetical protein